MKEKEMSEIFNGIMLSQGQSIERLIKSIEELRLWMEVIESRLDLAHDRLGELTIKGRKENE